jgi:hypothetical protein
MKKLLLYTLAGMLAACSNGPEKSKETQTAETPAASAKTVFPWLQGKWMIDYGETKIYESWKQDNEHMLTGTAYVVNKGTDTVMTELMKIQNIGGTWVFIAKIDNNNPVLFTAKATESDTKLVFENAEHDFPQTVTYATGAEGLYASIAGKQNGKPQQEEFRYTSQH